MKQYEIEVKHDNGTILLRTSARNINQAIDIIMQAENCPRRAIGCWRVIPTKKQIARTKNMLRSL